MAARPILNEEKNKVATGLLEYSMLTRGKQDKKNIQSLLVIVAYLVHFSSLFFSLSSSLPCVVVGNPFWVDAMEMKESILVSI